MTSKLDPAVAGRLVAAAMSSAGLKAGSKIVCTRRALRQAFQDAVQTAYFIGLHAAARHDRPAWTNIRLDSPEQLARHAVALKPATLRRLRAAGYCTLGDLRGLPASEFTAIRYIGAKTARQIAELVRQFENGTP